MTTTTSTTTSTGLKTEFLLFGVGGSVGPQTITNRINEILKDNEYVDIAIGGDAKVVSIVLVYRPPGAFVYQPRQEQQEQQQQPQKLIQHRKKQQPKPFGRSTKKK